MPENYAPQPRLGHSTGPRTQNGKAISSRNSTTHGCCSNQIIIKGESEEAFKQLLEDWLRDYEPEDSLQRSFIEQAVHAQWILRRNTLRYNELEKSLEDKSILDWSEEDHKKFERFTRYKTTAERAFTRAFTQLEQLRKRVHRDAEQASSLSLRHSDRRSTQEPTQMKTMPVETGLAASMPAQKPSSQPETTAPPSP